MNWKSIKENIKECEREEEKGKKNVSDGREEENRISCFTRNQEL